MQTGFFGKLKLEHRKPLDKCSNSRYTFRMRTREKIVEYVEKYREEFGKKPSYRNIAKEVGLKSPSSVKYHMEASGYKHVAIFFADGRNRILDLLGNKCSVCGFSDARALHIDHRNGGGYRERKRLGQKRMYKKILEELESGFLNNYQLLCANCNWIKRHENKELVRFKPIS